MVPSSSVVDVDDLGIQSMPIDIDTPVPTSRGAWSNRVIAYDWFTTRIAPKTTNGRKNSSQSLQPSLPTSTSARGC